MMRLEFEGRGIDGMGEEALKLLRPKAADALKALSKSLVAAFKKETGRLGVGRDVASRPGEPPMAESKAYTKAFSRRIVNKKSKPYVEAQLGNRMWHTLGRWLNYGTKNMQPRPHIEPVLERSRAEIERTLGDL